MVVQELIEALKKMPQDSDVYVAIGEIFHGEMFGSPYCVGVPERIYIDKTSKYKDCIIECYYGD